MNFAEFEGLRTRVVLRPGAVENLAAIAKPFAQRRVLVVTDPGLVAAGHSSRVEALLRDAGFEVSVFADVHENPTTDDAEACRAFCAQRSPELVVGLGGGSAIDVAKAALFLHAGGGAMRDYQGVGKARGALLPLIAIPTTAGTGSDVQSFALIADAQTHQKMACGDPQAAPRVAILDPVLTVTQPRFVTACTGLDAIGHAVETAVTTKRNERSAACARRAFLLADAHFERVLEAPDDLEARAGMLEAAAWAGIAIESSMLGAAHSMANPLTAQFGVVHGEAVALALPHVVRFNARDEDCARIYAETARDAGLCAQSAAQSEAVDALVARLERFLQLCGTENLRARGVDESAISELAEGARAQWTAQFNPRAVDLGDFVELYRQALANA